MKQFGATIVGTGSYTPERILTNHDLEQMVDTSDEWIQARTGIRERHIAAPQQATSDLAFEAAKSALAQAGCRADDIDLIIVATISPDRPFPNTACFLQKKLGADQAACFSLEAACSGFVYALQVAASLIRTGAHRRALVVGAEKISMFVDWQDRNTCVLFGDGAGAVVLEATTPESDIFLAANMGADGSYAELLTVPAGGSQMPPSRQAIEAKKQYLKMEGREVFKLAVNAMVESAKSVMREAGLESSQLRWLIPHQANTRIIQAVGKRLAVPEANVFMNLDKYGNTSAATIPICLDQLNRGGHLTRGDYVLMVAFGGGLTWGASLLRWPGTEP